MKKMKNLMLVTIAFLGLSLAFNNCSNSFVSTSTTSESDLASEETGNKAPISPTNPPATPLTPVPTAPSGDYAPNDGPAAKLVQVKLVSTAPQLMAAIAAAVPGDEITLENGTYTINTDKVRINRAGTELKHIFIRAKNPLMATISLCTSSAEGFYIPAPGSYWVFENLRIINGCETTTDHAFHIVGGSHHIIVRNNVISNFRSHVKVNGEADGSARAYPNDLWFIKNVWNLTHALATKAVPHNILNIDGGLRHIVRGNVFSDILRQGGSSSSIYIKMGTKDYLVEQNLVVCQKKVLGTGFSPRGIYGGDANTIPNAYCENQDCTNYRGLYRNNIVMNCNGDGNVSGIQVRLENDTKYTHNTVHSVKNNFYFNEGATVDVSFYSNIMEKPFTFAGTTKPTAYLNNLEQGTAGTLQIWNNPAIGDFGLKDGSSIRSKIPKRADTPHDFCGNLRAATTDLGAIDYSHAKASECVNYIKNLYNAI